MYCANVCGYPLRHQAMQLYVELPLELIDRTRDIDMVYLQMNPLIF
tara:strand:+ start:1324 stop:1461 length:138 start_codon:yes stop_codon:yes gene_type:complete